MIDMDSDGEDRRGSAARNGQGHHKRVLPTLARTDPPESEPAGTGEPRRPPMGKDPDGADGTLGGYLAVHDRPPAFEGSDGQPYTVAVDVEETDDPTRPFVAFLIFLRWAASGAGIMEHIESGDVSSGQTEAEARRGALALSLLAVRAELDAAIARRERDLSS